MVVLKRSEFNRTKANNNKTKHKQNSKKEELKEMLKMSTIHFETQLCMVSRQKRAAKRARATKERGDIKARRHKSATT
jgi:hypothetical protein